MGKKLTKSERREAALTISQNAVEALPAKPRKAIASAIQSSGQFMDVTRNLMIEFIGSNARMHCDFRSQALRAYIIGVLMLDHEDQFEACDNGGTVDCGWFGKSNDGAYVLKGALSVMVTNFAGAWAKKVNTRTLKACKNNGRDLVKTKASTPSKPKELTGKDAQVAKTVAVSTGFVFSDDALASLTVAQLKALHADVIAMRGTLGQKYGEAIFAAA